MIYGKGFWAQRELSEQFQYRSSAPVGFTFLLGLCMQMIQDKEVALQVLPILFHLLLIPVTCLVCYRLTDRKSVAILALFILLLSPGLSEFSVRVKQYSLDALCVMVIVGLAVETCRRRKMLYALAGAVLAVIPFSYCGIFVGAIVFNGILVLTFDRAKWRSTISIWSVVHLALFIWWLLIIRSHSNAALANFWQHNFPENITELIVGYGGLLAAGWRPAIAVTTGSPWIVLLVGAVVIMGIVRVWRTPPYRPLAVAVTGVYAGIGMLAYLKMYPLGGGRTDLFLVPLTSVLLACGVLMVIDRLPTRRVQRITVGVLVLALFVLGHVNQTQVQYPTFGVALPALQAAEADALATGSRLVIVPHATFLFCFYTRFPVDLEPSVDYATGFSPVPRIPNVQVLRGVNGYASDPTLLDPELDVLIDEGFERLVVLLERELSSRHVHQRLTEAGYRGRGLVRGGYIMVVVYERH